MAVHTRSLHGRALRAPLSLLLYTLLGGLGGACSSAAGRAEAPAAEPVPMEEVAAIPAAAGSTDLGAQVAAGLEVYRQQYCGVCHVLDTAGTAGAFGPTHNGMGATAEERVNDAAYSGMAATPEEYILESLVNPSIYIAPGYERTRFTMPAYTHLSEADLNALVQMLLQEK